MHYFLFLGVLLLNFTGCNNDEVESQEAPSAQEEEIIELRVLTYNIFHGESTNGDIDMDLFAEIINDQSPDLVALQEVDKNTTRVGGIDITDELSKRTGLKGYFGKFRNYKGGEYGAAILSKLPVVEFNVEPAYVSPEGVERSHLFARVEVADGKYIYFNSSHLSNIYEERAAQLDELEDYYKKSIGTSPMIISGDLNAEPDSEEMKGILKLFAVSDTSLANTFSTRTGMRKKIDFVLYPHNEDWEVIETKRICRVDASDHCALLSVIEFKVDL